MPSHLPLEPLNFTFSAAFLVQLLWLDLVIPVDRIPVGACQELPILAIEIRPGLSIILKPTDGSRGTKDDKSFTEVLFYHTINRGQPAGSIGPGPSGEMPWIVAFLRPQPVRICRRQTSLDCIPR
jgi:hypothetical protein